MENPRKANKEYCKGFGVEQNSTPFCKYTDIQSSDKSFSVFPVF